LELDIAERAYQLAKNAGMVLAIQNIKHETEKFVLMGHVAMILHQHDLTEELFTKSSQPHLALDMRCDLQDWGVALKLAKTLAPEKEPFICKKLALQMENENKFTEAKRLFEVAQLDTGINHGDKTPSEINAHNRQCSAGIARTSLRLGDVQRALNIVNSLNDNQLIIDIAGVCENMKQWLEAAMLFQKGGLPEKAASIYLQIKHLKEAVPLIDQVNSPKLLRELAKVEESQKHYKEAEKAYERANDWENVIRLNLKHLEDVEKAKLILREKSPTPVCAGMLADYCEKRGAKKEAIEFLVMAGKREEAFIMAQSHDEMLKYAEVVSNIDDRNHEEHLRIAQYFEGKNNWGYAARHYDKCENSSKALKLYIQGGELYIPEAIKMVGRLRNDALTHQLVDYLMGEYDGVPKEPQYTLQLYRELGNIKQAIKIAVTIATQEQEVGNYKFSHEILSETHRDIRQSNHKVPYDLNNKLMIIHSYVLAKKIMKMGDHLSSARLLIRVSKFISHFPMHLVNILTITVVQCSRALLKNAAYQWACILVRPENRSQLTEVK
jgi:WD repeat-containing protein 19